MGTDQGTPEALLMRGREVADRARAAVRMSRALIVVSAQMIRRSKTLLIRREQRVNAP